MNKSGNPHFGNGFTLLEALIIVFVLSVGLLAVTSFQGRLLSSGGELKTRADALALAEEKVEEFRNQIVKGDFTGLTNSSDAPAGGTNASFTRQWAFTSATGPTRKSVTVTVGWTDPKEGSLSIAVNSILTWGDPRASSDIYNGEIPGGGAIPAPLGSAEEGDGSTHDNEGTPNTGTDGNVDGTKTWNHDGKYELLAYQDGHWVSVLKSSTEFAKLSGRVYIKDQDITADQAVNFVFSAVSSIGYCRRSLDNLDLYADDYDTLQEVTDGTNIYQYFNYYCYIGAGWYGNIGIVDTSEAEGVNDQGFTFDACVGDPDQSAVTTTSGGVTTTVLTSPHTQEAFTRGYRGYQLKTDADGNAVQVAGTNPAQYYYLSTGISAGAVYDGHDFYIEGNLTGSETCQTQMSLVSPNQFDGSPGTFFCMSNSCPGNIAALDNAEQQSTPRTITIAVNQQNADVPGTVSDVYAEGISEITPCTASGDNWQCIVNDLGSGWTGSISATVSANHVMISPTIEFTQLTTDADGTANPAGTDSNGNTVEFLLKPSSTLYVAAITVTSTGPGSFSGVTVRRSGGWLTLNCTNNGSSYSCPIYFTASWSGTVTVTSDDASVICPDTTDGSKTYSYSGITADESLKVKFANNTRSCGK